MDTFDNDELLLKITEEESHQFKRLDHYLAHSLPSLSRSFIKKLFANGCISSDEKLELKKMPAQGVEICLTLPPPIETDLVAENIPLEILYEDEDLIIINKEAGMVVHPAPGHSQGTLVNALLYHCHDLKGIGQEKRPGIVHRLDKGTSGVMVVAKSQKCHEELVIKFSQHDIERIYHALVLCPRRLNNGRIETLYGRHPQHRKKMSSRVKRGKTAVTNYQLIEKWEEVGLMEFKLETGRTHQIRVHSTQELNCPLFMDPLYGNPKNHLAKVSENIQTLVKDYPHPFLHAKVLGFIHPLSKKQLYFDVPPPALFQEVVALMRSSDA